MKYIDSSKLYLLIDGTSSLPSYESQSESFTNWFLQQGGHIVSIGEYFNERNDGALMQMENLELTTERRQSLIVKQHSQELVRQRLHDDLEVVEEAVKKKEADVAAAFALLRNPLSGPSVAVLEDELDRLGVAEAEYLNHVSKESLYKIASHLKEAPASLFLSHMSID